MYCAKCGKQIPEDSKYCNYCGNQIKKLPTPKTHKTEKKSFFTDENLRTLLILGARLFFGGAFIYTGIRGFFKTQGQTLIGLICILFIFMGVGIIKDGFKN